MIDDNNGETLLLARIIKKENEYGILLNPHYLKDYLAARNCYLICFYDRVIYSEADIEQFFGKKKHEIILRDLLSFYKIIFDANHCFHKSFKCFSLLIGKDIIEPYAQPDKRHFTWFERDDREYAEFIYGRDEKGNELFRTCDQEKDRVGEFLTPIFFKREVLLKYYNEMSKYNVDSNKVKCLNIWILTIDITDEELVHVWLGDLGRIPYEEQLHWKQYNVVPRGTITEHRYRRDLMGEWADPVDDSIFFFWRAFDELQEISKRNLEDYLFMKLKKDDEYNLQIFRLPLTEDLREFDEQIQALEKITNDSINVALLKGITTKGINGNEVKGPIDLLRIFLQKRCKQDDIETIILAFHQLQNIRSTSSAHRKGKGYFRALKQYNLKNLSNRKKF